jgi:hypothetical protein
MKETLSVPEENLEEVIRVIRAGLKTLDKFISKDTRHNLEKWCKEEEKYLEELRK